MKVSVVIPAHDEEDRVGATVRAARSLPGVGEVVVVDDGSRDKTAERARAAGARVVRMDRNRGKALALRAGLREVKGEVVLLLDADLGASAGEAVRLLEPVVAGNCDLAVARFPPGGSGGGFGLAVGLARWGIFRLAGRRLEAPLSGQRAIRREILGDGCRFGSRWEVEVGMTIDALRSGYRLMEVPTGMEHRVTGRRMRDVLHRAGQLWGVAKALCRRLL